MDGSAIVVDTALPVNSEPKRLNANLYTQSNARIWDKSISLAGIQTHDLCGTKLVSYQLSYPASVCIVNLKCSKPIQNNFKQTFTQDSIVRIFSK